MSKLDVILVNWNSGPFIANCIDSIQKSNHEDINKIIVIDNASQDNSLKKIPIFDKVEIHKNKINEGFSKACNIGASYSDEDYILFLNPDTKVFKETISGAFAKIRRQQDIGILGVSLVNEHNHIVRTCSRFLTPMRVFSHSIGLTRILKSSGMAMLDWDHQTSSEVDQVMGAFFLTRRKLFDELKGFDENFFVYYEEMDYCYRASLLGYRSFYETSLRAYHYGGGTTENIISERLFYTLRSRILYSIKNLNVMGCIFSILSTLFVEMFTRIFISSILKLSLSDFINSSKAYIKLISWFIGYLFNRSKS